MAPSFRGRPKKSTIPDLIKEGEENEGPWKCKVCSRNFPRRKSLVAHERIHTDDTPYRCTYPGCDTAFRQSGQLATHIRCHTGEKPFICTAPGCTQRYNHSNRKCPLHQTSPLIRDGKEEIKMDENMSDEEIKWLMDYKQIKEKKKIRKAEDDINRRKKIKRPNPTPSTSSGGSCSFKSEEKNNFSQENKDVKTENNSSPTPSTSSGFSSASGISTAQDEVRTPEELQVDEVQPQMPDDSDAVEAARILCSFFSRAV